MKYLLVGLGNIGAKRQAVLGDRCVATVDPFNPAADYRSPADCEQPYDAAILAVPTAEKVPLLELFLARGIPVLVEKPLLIDAITAEALRALAVAHKTIWYTSYNLRFEPHVVTLKRYLEEGTLGQLYRARMFYGNGSAPTMKGTWRDDRYGVVADLACHLIDLAGFLFGRRGARSQRWMQRDCGLTGPDHCVLASTDGTVILEASWTSWRNRWQIEVTGADGSVSITGLTKWGRSEWVHEERSRAGGVPAGHLVVEGSDPTWAVDLQHFEERIARRESSYDNDLWISRVVMEATT